MLELRVDKHVYLGFTELVYRHAVEAVKMPEILRHGAYSSR